MVVVSHAAHPLPLRLTPFVGRQADTERILSLFQNPSVRLVTLRGTGGIGKTRLAIEVARLLSDRFQQHSVFVALARLSTAAEFLPALAGVFDVKLPPGGDLKDALLGHLAGQDLLLVLDSFEHLLDEASFLSEILSRSPQIRILLTSREKLNLEAETVYHLEGLELPPADVLENVQDYGAIGLFLQKAGQAQPGFSLRPDNISAVIQICRLVDGNPLAILLAAAWLEYFSPAEIVAEICHGLDFLSNELRDAEPRHSSMLAVFDSSFDRLEEDLRRVFQKLSVFRGGFDLPAAAAIAGADLRSLIDLADKSLLTRDPHSGRYELHELLRQYADERLQDVQERQEVLEAYTAYYVAFVSRRETMLISSLQTAALDEIQADFDNIRQAFTQVAERRDFNSVRALLPGLYAFCDMRSRFHDGEAMFRQAAETLAPPIEEPPHGAWALALLSWFDMRMYVERLESYEEITSQAHACLEQCSSTGDAQAVAASLNLLGAIAQHQNDFRTAIRYCRAAMQAFPQLDEVYWVNMRIGLCYEADHQYDEAIQSFRSCLERGRRTGEKVKTAWSLQNIGDTLFLQGRLLEAQNYVEQALPLFQEVNTPIGVLWAMDSLSRVASSLGRLERARELATAAVHLARQIQWESWIRKTDALLRQLHPEAAVQRARPNSEEFDEPLSERELEVLRLLQSELNGPAIAEQLVVSLNTVRYHTKNIYRKLGVSTRLEAIRRAKERGL